MLRPCGIFDGDYTVVKVKRNIRMKKTICLLLCGLLTGIIIEYSQPYPYKILRGNIKKFIFLSKEARKELTRDVAIGKNKCGTELSKYTQYNPPTDIIVGV